MNQESKRSKQEPKLYIQQPGSLPIPEASMQKKFHYAPSQNPETMEQGNPSQRHKRKVNFATLHANLEEEATEEIQKNEMQEEKPEPELEQESEPKDNSRKRFQDMSLEEKIYYFVRLPKQVPKMKCQVKTSEGKTYRGLVTNYEDGLVQMKVYQRPYQVNLPFETIKEIRLLGF